MEYWLQRLANHANMSDTLPEEQSLSWHLWQATRTGTMPDIEPLRDDVLNCLEEINIIINGSPPSEYIVKPMAEIPSVLILYVCEIIQSCYEYALIWEHQSLFSATERELLKQTAWIIMQAWCFVLHGDIDDISSEVWSSGQIKGVL